MSKLFNNPNPETKLIAQSYKDTYGIVSQSGENIYNIDVDFCKRVADAYEQMKHEPDNRYVKASYELLVEQTKQQFRYITHYGYIPELWEGETEPYLTSEDMLKDISKKHLWILPTNKQFGNEGITDEQRLNNPLLQPSGYIDICGDTLLVNDCFRFVHDHFGHSERGNGFGPIGEFNAWDAHMRLYTDIAQYAMTTETLGQNCWVNFGPHMRNDQGELIKEGENGYLKPSQRPFAPQKIGLLSNFIYPSIK